MGEINKRILFVFRTLGTGGAQKIQAFVANACFRAGYDVLIVSMSSDASTVNVDPAIPVYVVDYDKTVKVSSNKILQSMQKLVYLAKMRKMIRKLHSDLLCVFLIDVIRIVHYATRGMSIPILASERGDPSQYTEKSIAKYSKVLNRCNRVVFQLEHAKSYYRLHETTKTDIIPNPCVPKFGDSFHQVKKAHVPLIISAGRLCPQKRFDVLIQAFKIVHDKYPEYRLRIYGDGEDKEKLEALIHRLKLENAVELAGDVRDVFSLGEKPQIFALSSDYEGIPNVLIEAMASGIPCIATDCTPGGAAFLLDHGRRGYLVPRGDHHALGIGIIHLIENPEERARYVGNAHEIFDLFSPSIISDLWIQSVEKCLQIELKDD